ncbi:hypothetical protein ACLOJK_004850 [Asimina triloba]
MGDRSPCPMLIVAEERERKIGKGGERAEDRKWRGKGGRSEREGKGQKIRNGEEREEDRRVDDAAEEDDVVEEDDTAEEDNAAEAEIDGRRRDDDVEAEIDGKGRGPREAGELGRRRCRERLGIWKAETRGKETTLDRDTREGDGAGIGKQRARGEGRRGWLGRDAMEALNE